MAKNYGLMTAFVVILALASVEHSSCYGLKGSVACMDCDHHYDLSGMKVLVKCNHVKKLGMATTLENGSFNVKIPSDSTPTPDPANNCVAKILGGPNQVYSSKKNMVSKMAKSQQSSSYYTVSQPLNFYTSCPDSLKKDGKCGSTSTETGSSKTIDLPLPKEWGLAPTSYYVPFMPIIGIP